MLHFLSAVPKSIHEHYMPVNRCLCYSATILFTSKSLL